MSSIISIFYWAFLWAGLTGSGINPSDKPSKKKSPEANAVTTIAFGSGNRNDMPQPLWADILVNKPQVWIWLGGNSVTETQNLGMLKEAYQRQLQEPGYSALRESASVIGTWDHHEYGGTGGKEFAHKAESQQLFFDFLGESADSPLRQQAGIYSAHTYGPKGKQVKVILLDTRYHRDPPAKAETKEKKGKKKKKKKPEPAPDILGEEQWVWLEKELKSNPAQLTIIGNSTQIIPDEHTQAKWANYPNCRERLLNLISRTKSDGVVLLSGERNLAEISSLEVKGRSQPVFEITSSGLTHTVGRDYKPEANRYRVGQLVAKQNFGLIQIDWEKREASLQVHGDRNQTYLSQAITF